MAYLIKATGLGVMIYKSNIEQVLIVSIDLLYIRPVYPVRLPAYAIV